MSVGFIPVGLLCALLLLSGVPVFVRIALKIRGFGITIGNFNLPVHLVCLWSMLGLTFMQGVSLKNNSYENDPVSIAMTSGGIQSAHVQDRLMGRRWRDERNFWMCVTGTTIWMVVSRLGHFMETSRVELKKSALLRRLTFLLLASGVLFLMDISFARIHYNFLLASQVTPLKEELMFSSGVYCEDATLKNPVGQAGKNVDCAMFCNEVKVLAALRSSSMHSVRWWHPAGTNFLSFYSFFIFLCQSQMPR